MPRILRAAFRGLGPVFPGLMGGWAYRLWFRTRRHAGSAAEQMTVLVDGIPVAVYRWGGGLVRSLNGVILSRHEALSGTARCGTRQ